MQWSSRIQNQYTKINCISILTMNTLKRKLWKQFHLQYIVSEAVLRWRRNRIGRTLSPPQIHQKNLWMQSKFHRTTSECWQRTLDIQKSSPLSLKGGRTKYKRQTERQELGMETPPGEGVMKEEKFPKSRTPSHRWVCGEFWNLRGQHNWEEKKQNPQNRCLTATASGEVAQMLTSTTSEWGLNREAWVACLG